MKNYFDVKGKVIVITGGAGILGKGMSEYMAEQGCKVVVLDRVDDAGNALVADIKAKGGDAIYLSTDVLNKEVLEQNAKDIVAAYGRIDILVNAAGGNMPGATIAPGQTIFDLQIDAFQKVVDLNLFGTVLPCMVFGKIMVDKKEGSIINISSESAIRPLTRVVGYGSSKAAVTNFTQFLATEMATKFSEKIRVNAMAPGFFLTEQNRALMSNEDGTPSDRCKTILAHTPFGRLGEADELFGTLHWLASDASKFVTGTLTVVDGGFDAFCI